jgi:hypothetical protein
MAKEGKRTASKKYHSLEEFDRAFFPDSADREGREGTETGRFVARLKPLVGGQLQEPSKRMSGTKQNLPHSGKHFVSSFEV